MAQVKAAFEARYQIPFDAFGLLDLEGGGTEFARRHFRHPYWVRMFSPSVASML